MYKSVINSGRKWDFRVDKAADNKVRTWVKLGSCARIGREAVVGGVYESWVYALFIPLSVRRLYTFFTQAKDVKIGILLRI